VYIFIYTTPMVKKGTTGNKEQLAIALELSHKLSTKEVAEKLGKPLISVQKIQTKIKKGWKPDLSEEAIANAPASPGFMGNVAAKKPAKKDGTSSENPSGNGAEDGEKEEPKKVSKPQAGYLALAAIQIRSVYTPIMYMARLAAEDKWGWSGDISYEDFIDICLYHFFKDRGITLQGYIVDEDVNKPGNGELKELKETVLELVNLVKKGAKEEAKT